MRNSACFLFRPIIVINWLLLISCAKEIDNNAPSISIVSPPAHSQYSAGDTIHLSAQFSDDKKITRIEVKLMNNDKVAVTNQSVIVGAANYVMEFDVYLKKELTEGIYYLDIRAFDEYDYSAVYHYVNISGGQKSLKKIVVFTEGNNSVLLNSVTDSSLTKLSEFKGDILESAATPAGKILFAGKYSPHVYSLDSSGQENWKYLSQSLPGIQYFNDLQYSENLLLTSTLDGRILGFDANGNKVVEIVGELEYEIGKIHQHESSVIYEKVRKSSGQLYIRNDYFPSGLLKNEVVFNHGKVKDIESIALNKLLIFSDKNDEHFVFECNTDNMFMSLVYSETSAGDFSDGLKLPNGEVLILKAGDLMKFNIENRDLSVFISGHEAELVRYDEVMNLIWLSSGTDLIAFDIDNQSEVFRYNVGSQILSFEILYSY